MEQIPFNTSDGVKRGLVGQVLKRIESVVSKSKNCSLVFSSFHEDLIDQFNKTWLKKSLSSYPSVYCNLDQ